MLAPVKEPSSVSLDVKLRDELLKLEAKGEDKAKNTTPLCAILGRVGWPVPPSWAATARRLLSFC